MRTARVSAKSKVYNSQQTTPYLAHTPAVQIGVGQPGVVDQTDKCVCMHGSAKGLTCGRNTKLVPVGACWVQVSGGTQSEELTGTHSQIAFLGICKT